MSISILERYRKYSAQLEHESKRLDRWHEVMPLGQPYPSYVRALHKHARSFEKRLFPLWLKIRSRVDITKSGKTLWQELPRYTQTFPPMYREIKPLLKLKVERKVRPLQIQTFLVTHRPRRKKRRKKR